MSDSNSGLGTLKSQLEAKTMYQLKELGSRMGLAGLSKLKKSGLVEKLLAHPDIAKELMESKASTPPKKSWLRFVPLGLIATICTIGAIPLTIWLSKGTDEKIEKVKSSIVKNQDKATLSIIDLVNKEFDHTNYQIDQLNNNFFSGSNAVRMIEQNFRFAHALDFPEIRPEVEDAADLFDRLDISLISSLGPKVTTQFYLEKAFRHQLDGDLNQAIDYLEKARPLVETMSDDVGIQFRFNTQEGIVADRLGIPDRAFACFEKALRFNNSIFVSFMAASTAFYAGNPRTSAKYFEIVLNDIECRRNLNPSLHLAVGNAVTLTNLSQCYLSLDDLPKATVFAEGAKSAFLEIIENDETRKVELSHVHRLLSQIARKSDDFELSYKEIDTAIKYLSESKVKAFGLMDSQIAIAASYLQKATWLRDEKELEQARLMHEKIARLFLETAHRDSLEITGQIWTAWLDERFQVFKELDQVALEVEIVSNEIELLMQHPETLSEKFAVAMLLSSQGQSLFYLGKSSDAMDKYSASNEMLHNLSILHSGPQHEVIRSRMQLYFWDSIEKLQSANQ
jgi:tetratricopeptide (TPR) repeat protein